MLSSWLLLKRTTINASKATVHTFLGARLELFWAEDWSALWTMVRAESGPSPGSHTQNSHTAEVVTRLPKLLHQHVLVKKDELWQPPGMHHHSQSQRRLFKRSKVSTQQTQNIQLPHRPLCQTYQKSLSSSPPLSAKCHDSRTWTSRHACSALV